MPPGRGYHCTSMGAREGSSATSGVDRLASGEMHPGPGFRVRAEIERVPPEIVRGFAGIASAMVSDRLNRLYTMSSAIVPMTAPELTVVGSAVTVKVFPGDNLMVHKSLDVIQPGDVIVVDASSSTMTAVIGDMVAAKARHRGAAGIVVDGLVRDRAGIQELGDLPVFARGTTPIGPLHRGPGEVNFPVSCGGIVVHPGDVIVGDGDGVVVVPGELAADVLDDVTVAAAADAEYGAAVRRGDFSMAWVDAALDQAGLHLPRPGSPPRAG